jgi:hypothetical protein
MNAMTQKDYKKVCNNRYTMVVFDLNGDRFATRGNYPMHSLVEEAVGFTRRGFTVRIWDEAVAKDLKIFTRCNRIEDFQTV